jgi:serine protease Do
MANILEQIRKPVVAALAMTGAIGIAGVGLKDLREIHVGSTPAFASSGAATVSASAPASAPVTATVAPASVAAPDLFVSIADRLTPSVVNIFTSKNYRVHRFGPGPGFGPGFGGGADPNEFWRRFFGEIGPDIGAGAGAGAGGGVPRGDSQGEAVPQAMALGSGFVVESDDDGGLILTNNHVIASADDVKVKFTEEDGEKETPAKVIGTDPELDIALLRVKTQRKLTAVVLGDSDRLKVGEWIAAMGNPFGHGHSMSHGIVSAKARNLPGAFGRYLQVDAPINPGNSGGPLVALNGEVVGINNAIDARGQGIGFAIPINAVKALLPQLKSKGHVERGFIGINIEPLRPELARALKAGEVDGSPVVTQVVPGAPAEKAGIQPYDVIVEMDGKAIRSPEALVSAVTSVPVGKQLEAKVLRSGKEFRFRMDVAKR